MTARVEHGYMLSEQVGTGSIGHIYGQWPYIVSSITYNIEPVPPKSFLDSALYGVMLVIQSLTT